MRTLRRALLAVGIGGVLAAGIRLRAGGRCLPPQSGGWRELSGSDLR